jgi:release factor glutamine methyltransferase
MTINEALEEGIETLKSWNIDEASANVEIFLSEQTGYKRSQLKLYKSEQLTTQQVKKFEDFLKKRTMGMPLQYILGKVEFFGCTLAVNKNVLIPRPETEQLVEKVVEEINISQLKNVRIYEVGTGSGCISIALGKELESKGLKYNIISVDISEKVIDTASKNLKANGLDPKKIRFKVEDFLNIKEIDDIDYLVSNPPYIALDDYEELDEDVKDFEPRSSLTDEKDGLTFYRKIAELISCSNNRFKTFCEIGFGQKEAIESILNKNKITGYKFHKDYNGIDRILEISL